jgi:ATP-dependent Clp endopeptidase proteolytic subunit ClpP
MVDKVTEELSMALIYGVDVQGRRIFLHSDIEETSMALIVRALYLLSTDSNPVELFVTSYGGSLDDAFALHDVTRTIDIPVHTVALGKCMSAAPLLVACGDVRYATENTLFMLHDIWFSMVDGRPREIEAHTRVATKQVNRYADLLARYTKRPKGHWRRLMRRGTDQFFGAEQALDWGLIDQIWSEKDND